MSDYQSRGQGGWPEQPAAPSYGQATYDQGPYGQEPTALPRRRRRRRWPVVLLVVVIAILVILGVGDQVAKSYAQGRIAQEIQTSAKLSAKPSVSIKGWPFLTQVAAHDLKEIDFSANDVTADGGTLPFSVTATATDVHPDSSFSSATAGHITGQVTITFQALDSYLGRSIGIPGLSGLTLSPDPSAGPSAATANLGGGLATVTATAVKSAANTITIDFGPLGGLASALGGATSIPAQTIVIPALPAGLVVGQPTVTSQGLVIPASASNTTLSQ